MVLYMSQVKGEKPEKTGWVMHQYHLGVDEEEKDGEFVVSKLFYQQQCKPNERIEAEFPVDLVLEPVKELEPIPCPNSATPDPPAEKRFRELKSAEEDNIDDERSRIEDQTVGGNINHQEEEATAEDGKWWDGDSQFLMDSQQLAEGMAMCDEFLQSQNTCENGDGKLDKPCLADYAKIGVQNLKKDLEECQKIGDLELSNIELDVPDMRLSQLV